MIALLLATFAHAQSFSAGDAVRIRDVSTEDAFHSSREELVGQICTVDAAVTANEAGWISGAVTCPGSSYYFFEVALEPAPKAAPVPGSAIVGVRASGRTVSAGNTFRIADIDPEDAYYAERERYLGLTCTASDALNEQAPGWYSGSATCEGSDLYFYKVGIVMAGPPVAGFTEPKIPKGFPVRVTAAEGLPPALSGVVGSVCVTDGVLKATAPGHYKGTLNCDGVKVKLADVSVARP